MIFHFKTNCIYSVLIKVVKTCFMPCLHVWQYAKYKSFKQSFPLLSHCGGGFRVRNRHMPVIQSVFLMQFSLTYLIEESRKCRPPVAKQFSLLLKNISRHTRAFFYIGRVYSNTFFLFISRNGECRIFSLVLVPRVMISGFTLRNCRNSFLRKRQILRFHVHPMNCKAA